MRTRAELLVVAALVFGAAIGAVPGGPAPDARDVIAIVDPTADITRDIAAHSDIDVRWAERGLVVGEVAPGTSLPAAWNARVVARRPGNLELGLLRGSDVAHTVAQMARSKAAAAAVLMTVARVPAVAGEAWILFAPPGTWPEDLIGCHGGLVLAGHHLDPRTIFESAPPAALGAPHAWSAQARAVIAAVAAETLQANVNALGLDSSGQPANRYVFGAPLATVYGPWVEHTMQRLTAGIPGAAVSRQPFDMRRCVGDSVTNGTNCFQTASAYNVVARIPGTVPGTGIFVVCAHLDATGSRNVPWSYATGNGLERATPGAEDNASGVACVLEMLRNTAEGVRTGSVAFAFDLEFVAFSGEEVPALASEQGLVGSEQYVLKRTAEGVRFLGCFNFDMVGYNHLPDNLQIVYNPASHWMANLVRDAVLAQAPPRLVPVLEIDEQRASDHNSFWARGVPAVLSADAPVDSLRRYSTYHHPTDVVAAVVASKLAQTTRALLGALLRFDTVAPHPPQLLFAPEELRLLRPIGGSDFTYRAGFHILHPGTPLRARTTVRSVGNTYAGPLRIELATVGGGAPRRVFFDSSATVDVPPGGFIQVDHLVPILTGDAGTLQVEARVTSVDTTGVSSVQSSQQGYNVAADVLAPGAIVVRVKPNPVRDLASAKIEVDVERHANYDLDIFDLEGQRLAGWSGDVEPRSSGGVSVSFPLSQLARPGTALNLRSGAYIVRVRRHGAAVESASTTVPLVIVR